jgi:hypothetical protein
MAGKREKCCMRRTFWMSRGVKTKVDRRRKSPSYPAPKTRYTSRPLNQLWLLVGHYYELSRRAIPIGQYEVELEYKMRFVLSSPTFRDMMNGTYNWYRMM